MTIVLRGGRVIDRSGERIADVGAGTGLYLALFAELVGEDGHVFALDISPVFVEHLRARARAMLAPFHSIGDSGNIGEFHRWNSHSMEFHRWH